MLIISGKPILKIRDSSEQKNSLNIRPPSSLSQVLILNEDPLDFFQETSWLAKKFLKKGIMTKKDRSKLFINTKKYPISFAPPLNNIHCYRDFYVHQKHVEKGFEKRGRPVPKEWFEMPVFYKGPTAGFIGDGETIVWPSYTKKLDYELELGAIIGRDGKNIKATKAFEHIFGFTFLNDVSARDIQKKEMAVGLGPSKEKTFAQL